MAKLRLKMKKNSKNIENYEEKIKAILVVKASQKLAEEIEQELEEEDPVDAKQLISKNRVIDE